MIYGNYYTGYSYSPDRSRDVDRFNPSTRQNYTTHGSIANSRESSTASYSYYDPTKPYYSNGNRR